MSQSKRTKMRLSGVVSLAIAFGMLIITVKLFRRDYLRAGFETLAVTAFLVAAYSAFLVPMKCRVETVKGRPCRKEAYGFLFGCSTARHGVEKFYARLHRRRGAYKSFAHASPRKDTSAATHLSNPASPESAVIVIATEGQDKLSVFVGIGTLAVGVVSAIAGVLAVH